MLCFFKFIHLEIIARNTFAVFLKQMHFILLILQSSTFLLYLLLCQLVQFSLCFAVSVCICRTRKRKGNRACLQMACYLNMDTLMDNDSIHLFTVYSLKLCSVFKIHRGVLNFYKLYNYHIHIYFSLKSIIVLNKSDKYLQNMSCFLLCVLMQRDCKDVCLDYEPLKTEMKS